MSQVWNVLGQVFGIDGGHNVARQFQTAKTMEAGKVIQSSQAIVTEIHGIERVPRHSQMLDCRYGKAPQYDLPLSQRIRPLLGGS
mmetsp:Transcript_111922/g.167583  ORF Transcript_111922/g.167583 Transcript_111922/m.167583 type:complete len:85 (+) Transcript_111922:114-368(+)